MHAGLNIFVSFVIDTYKEGINAGDDDEEEDFLDGLDDERVPSPAARNPYVILQGGKVTSSPAVKGELRTEHAYDVVQDSFELN